MYLTYQAHLMKQKYGSPKVIHVWCIISQFLLLYHIHLLVSSWGYLFHAKSNLFRRCHPPLDKWWWRTKRQVGGCGGWLYNSHPWPHNEATPGHLWYRACKSLDIVDIVDNIKAALLGAMGLAFLPPRLLLVVVTACLSLILRPTFEQSAPFGLDKCRLL